ncbi:cytochrome C oxidase subunit IV family protein [Nocardia jiangxiensis]|uniref:Cytochrome C oxidase subunit IV family protein n=1 Tax=Nocardia jiangxiensis TaxID=282685 RepID=A0ABW6S3S4_9NOCA|nr:cytochrome C oxidase subunit IV family protein [Nocardia jiangxiensis]
MNPLRIAGVCVWLLLVAATALSWALGTETGGAVTSLAVIVVAFAKVRLVGLHFMELRDAPIGLRAAFEVYLMVTGGLTVSVYLAG